MGIFPNKNHPLLGVPPFWGNPHIQIYGDDSGSLFRKFRSGLSWPLWISCSPSRLSPNAVWFWQGRARPTSPKLIWGFPKKGVPQNGWFIMETSHWNGWFGGTPISGNLHLEIPLSIEFSGYIYIYDFLKMEESPKPIGCHARMVIHDFDDLVDYSHGNGNLQLN